VADDGDESIGSHRRGAGLGVDVTTHFYEPDQQPELGHEYQFDLDTDEGNATFDRLVGFLRRATATTA